MLPVTAVIQAGGKSARMGTDKAQVVLHGRRLIDHVFVRLQQLEPAEILVIGSHDYGLNGVAVYPDVLSGSGPLGGIRTALEVAQYDNLLVVGCDMPFISPRLLAYLLELQRQAETPYQAVAPRHAGNIEGLHALYHKSALPVVRRRLESGQRAVSGLIVDLRSRLVDTLEYQHLGVDARAFLNINTPAELVAAESGAPVLPE